MFGGLFGALGGGFFDQNFRAYPVAFIEKESAEKGDKVILPPSSLNTLGMPLKLQCFLLPYCLTTPQPGGLCVMSRTSAW